MTRGTADALREVVLVGAGARARAWLEPLRRSARLRPVAAVARGDEVGGAELPRSVSLDEAMRRHPSAVFAIALPPRAGLEAALRLAEAGREGVIEAPLDDALLDARLGPGAAGVRVAHGWVTLPGLQAVAAVMRRAGQGRLRIEVAGLPEEDGGDAAEVLVHAAALVRALLPQATASAARHANDGALEIELSAASARGAWTVSLRLLTHGRRLTVDVESSAGAVRWAWEDDRENVTLGGTALIPPHTTPAASVRALAQLLPDAARGDGLVEAIEVLRLARSCLYLLPNRLPLGGRPLRQAASIARRRPSALLDRLGLRGELPADGGPPPEVLACALPPEPFELWPFRAGIKPVVFLTVRPEEVERTLAHFGAVAVERRDRLVLVDAQDCWTDRRDVGEPRVELYIARDAALARRAAALQAEADPTRALAELGVLLGYPACCVEAFASQDDRANNSRNRYASQARTCAPDGSATAPWPWELNNLHSVIAPFYPCSYRCERALEWARRALHEMARMHPGIAGQLRTVLARPVLYFDHDHQIVFDGELAGAGVAYRTVALAPSATPQLTALGAAISRGNRLTFDRESLRVEHDGGRILYLERTDPALGFVAPFGVAS